MKSHHLLKLSAILVLLISFSGSAIAGPKPEEVIKAIKAQDIKTLKKYFDTGIPADFKVAGDWTPLHFAADTGNVAIGKMLIGFGADVNAESLGGEIPLHRAVFKAHVPFVKLLLNNHSKLGVKSEADKTPLQYAQSQLKGKNSPAKTKALKEIVNLLEFKPD